LDKSFGTFVMRETNQVWSRGMLSAVEAFLDGEIGKQLRVDHILGASVSVQHSCCGHLAWYEGPSCEGRRVRSLAGRQTVKEHLHTRPRSRERPHSRVGVCSRASHVGWPGCSVR